MQEIWTASSGKTPWNAPSPLVVDEISRVETVGPSVEKRSDRQSARPTTRDRARQETAEFLRARQACAVSGNASPTDLVSSDSGEGDESAKPKEYFSWRKPGHSKGEYRYFSAVREKRLVPRDKRPTDTLPRILRWVRQGSWEREGTSVLSIIPERDVCLSHEDDDDQSAYSCPSPLIDRGIDDLEDLMVLPCQVWFDTEAPEAFERRLGHDRHDRAACENVSPIKGSNRRSQPTPYSSTRVLALRRSKESSPRET